MKKTSTRAAKTSGAIPLSAGHAAAAVAVLGVFAFQVHQNYFLGDDSFISFRYALHLSEGLGLVWNPGERVEGYTNFLWVLILAAGLRVGIPPEILSNVLGIASGVGVLAVTLWLGMRRPGPAALAWLAPAALALNRSFCAWSTGGLATQFFTLLVLLGFAIFLAERERDRHAPWGSAVCFAFAALTRPEGLLFAGVAGAFFAVDVLRGRRALGALLVWGCILALPVGAHFVWRHHYYGFWLPNTFYAKVSGAWWDQAARYFGLFLAEYRVHWFAPLVVVALVLGRRFENFLFAAVLTAYGAYLGYIGGDRFEFRFLVVVLPYFMLLVAEGLRQWVRLGSKKTPVRRAAEATAAALAIGLLATTAVGSAREPNEAWTQARILGVGAIKGYAERRASEGKALRRWIDEGVLPEDLRIATGGAGALPYYTRWWVLDYRGLNNVRIAHAPIEERGDIAHEKTASLDYLRESRVVAFDVLNGLLFEVPPPHLPFHAERARGSLRWHNREADRAGDPTRLRFECRRLGLGSYFIFGSPIDPDSVDRALGDLAPCRATSPFRDAPRT